jgi:DNA polymerase sigma
MPYALGNDKIAPARPKLEKLAPEQEAKLTKDMLDLFEVLKPDSGSNERRRRFLVKLERLLNDEWPGHDIKVHAFGSTENHLCMSDSDGTEHIYTPYVRISC